MPNIQKSCCINPLKSTGYYVYHQVWSSKILRSAYRVHVCLMFADPCIIVKFINKNQHNSTMYQNFIIPYLYDAQHVSGDIPPIIRSLKLHWQPLVFHTRKIVGRPSTGPTTFRVWKTRGCQCSFRLLMMGGVLPETCWASYKYWIIKFWYIVASCWFFFMN